MKTFIFYLIYFIIFDISIKLYVKWAIKQNPYLFKDLYLDKKDIKKLDEIYKDKTTKND